jgi:hypothetical protein
VDAFYVETFMDICTTMGPDCACNTHRSVAPSSLTSPPAKEANAEKGGRP